MIRFGTCAKEAQYSPIIDRQQAADPIREAKPASRPARGPRQPQQHPPVGQVLQPADGRLRAEIALPRQPLQRHFEHRIGAQRVGVDAVLVARRDQQQAKAQDIRDAVHRAHRIARIVDASRQPPRHVEPPLHFPQRQKTGVRRHHAAVETGAQCLAVHR